MTYECPKQGVVGFYDARDLKNCIETCSWTPRTGSLGNLTGAATVSDDGWVMNPRMVSVGSVGVSGSSAGS